MEIVEGEGLVGQDSIADAVQQQRQEQQQEEEEVVVQMTKVSLVSSRPGPVQSWLVLVFCVAPVVTDQACWRVAH